VDKKKTISGILDMEKSN